MVRLSFKDTETKGRLRMASLTSTVLTHYVYSWAVSIVLKKKKKKKKKNFAISNKFFERQSCCVKYSTTSRGVERSVSMYVAARSWSQKRILTSLHYCAN